MSLFLNKNIQSITSSKEQFLLTWHLTGWCNYTCNYCITKNFQTTWIDEKRILDIAENINKYLNKYRVNDRVCLRVVGGEVTYYDLPKILDKIEHIDKLNIATNLSQDINYFKHLIEYCANRKTTLILQCSAHAQNTNFKEKFITLTEWCRQNKYKDPHMMVVVTNEFDPNSLKDYLAKDIWKIRLSRCRNDVTYANEDLKPDLVNIIEKFNDYYDKRTKANSKAKVQNWTVTFTDGTTEEFLSASDMTNHLDQNGFIPDGFYCSVGKNSLAILPNGDVVLSRCVFLQNKVIGNIFDYDNIKLPESSVLCELNKNFTNKDYRCDLCSGANLVRKD